MACLHVVLAVLTAFEVLGFSGLHYGIAAIKLVWRDLGIYGYVCSANGTVFSAQTICNNQEEMYTLAFAIGIVLSAVGCFLYGFLEDKFDTHRVKFIPISFFIGGTMCLAFVAPGYDWLIFPGLSAIAISSLQILTIATKVTYFFPAKKEALSALLNGFFDSSAANFELVSVLHRRGFRYRDVLIGYCGLGASVMILTMMLYARCRHTASKGNSIDDSDRPCCSKRPPAGAILKFVLHNCWLSFNALSYTFLLSSQIFATTKLTGGDPIKIQHFTSVLSYFLLCGIVYAPLGGLFIKTLTFFGSRRSPPIALLTEAVIGWPLGLVCALSCTSLVILMTARSATALYVEFPTLLLLRYFLFATNAVFLVATYDTHKFGVLFGFTQMAYGFFCFLQYPLLTWSQAVDSLTPALWVILSMSIVSFLHPILYMWEKTKRIKKSYDISLRPT